jgi:hypothetical protein
MQRGRSSTASAPSRFTDDLESFGLEHPGSARKLAVVDILRCASWPNQRRARPAVEYGYPYPAKTVAQKGRHVEVARLGARRADGRGARPRRLVAQPRAAAALLAEAGRDDRDADLVASALVDHRSEDHVRVLVGSRGHHLGGLVHLEQAEDDRAGDVERSPPSIDDSRSGEPTATWAGSAAFSLWATLMPISAEPASRMIVRTSAKSG